MFLCSWNFPGKNTAVGCHFLLQEFFSTQGSNPSLLHWLVDSLPLCHLGGRLKTIGYKQITRANQDLKISVAMLIYASFISTFEFWDNYRWQEVQASDRSPFSFIWPNSGTASNLETDMDLISDIPFYVKFFLLHEDTLHCPFFSPTPWYSYPPQPHSLPSVKSMSGDSTQSLPPAWT